MIGEVLPSMSHTGVPREDFEGIQKFRGQAICRIYAVICDVVPKIVEIAVCLTAENITPARSADRLLARSRDLRCRRARVSRWVVNNLTPV